VTGSPVFLVFALDISASCKNRDRQSIIRHMQTLGAGEARFFLENIAVPWFKNEQPLTKKVIEAVPIDKGDYRPDPVARTAFELAWHIASAENRFLDG